MATSEQSDTSWRIVLTRLARCSVCIVLLALGCDPMNPAPDYYHVSLTLDGQEITLNYGLQGDTNLDDPVAFLTSNGSYIAFAAQNQQQGRSDYVSMCGWLSVTTPGSYVARYQVGDTASATMGILLGDSGIGYDYSTTSGFVTVDTFGDVDGDVEGSFYLVFESESAAPSYGTPLSASGEFRLLRLADSTEPGGGPPP